MLPGATSQLVLSRAVFETATVKHDAGDAQEGSKENYTDHVYSGTQSRSRGCRTPNDMHAFDWKKQVASVIIPGGGRKLTQKEIYK